MVSHFFCVSAVPLNIIFSVSCSCCTTFSDLKAIYSFIDTIHLFCCLSWFCYNAFFFSSLCLIYKVYSINGILWVRYYKKSWTNRLKTRAHTLAKALRMRLNKPRSDDMCVRVRVHRVLRQTYNKYRPQKPDTNLDKTTAITCNEQHHIYELKLVYQ